MKTWEDWSDFELGKKITAVREGFCDNDFSDISGNFHKGRPSDEGYKIGIVININSWSDMGQLIVGSKISIETADIINGELTWEAFCLFVDDWRSARHKNTNPLRAAAIVFLMMNGVNPND